VIASTIGDPASFHQIGRWVWQWLGLSACRREEMATYRPKNYIWDSSTGGLCKILARIRLSATIDIICENGARTSWWWLDRGRELEKWGAQRGRGKAGVSCHCPYFPLSARFSHFAFSRAIWTFNHTTKIPLLYHLFSTLLGEAIGIKQGYEYLFALI